MQDPMSPLTPNPNYSDAEADALGLVHEGMIILARGQRDLFTTIPGAGKRVIEAERLIQASVQALIDLGRPRLAPDLLAKGWELTSTGEWARRYTSDEYPFAADLEASSSEHFGFVYARNNDHARMIDGTIAVPKWGISYGTADDYVT